MSEGMNPAQAPVCSRCGHAAKYHSQGGHLGACTYAGDEAIGGRWTAAEVCSCGQYA